MFQKGAAWQYVRALGLNMIPPGTPAVPAAPASLAAWLSGGSYPGVTAVGRSYVVDGNERDVAGALLCDSLLHLDHATEHAHNARHTLSASSWYSSAWLVVTFYYWLFYLAIALTRLVGRTSVFLDDVTAKRLSALAGSANLGAGPYDLACQPGAYAARVTVTLAKSKKTRVHDSAFRSFAQIVNDALIAGNTEPLNDITRFLAAYQQACRKLGDSWPSEVRNVVNYMPGVGYGAVRRQPAFAAFNVVETDPSEPFDSVLDRFERNCASVPAIRPPYGAALDLLVKLLVDATLLIDALVRELHDEVRARRGLDIRWSNARRAFTRQQASSYNSEQWPCA